MDVTFRNVSSYTQRLGSLCRAERRMLSDMPAGTRVLELGCGDGRVTIPLAEAGAEAWGCDLLFEPLRSLRTRASSAQPRGLIQADARRLPFADQVFDCAFFAFAGIDKVVPEAGRILVLQEAAWVLRPEGKFIFSSHNPIGRIFSPRGLRRTWRSRLALLRGRSLRKTYIRSRRGMVMYQATPRRNVRLTERSTGMQLVHALTGHSGINGPLWMLALTSKRPYYVFEKRSGPLGHRVDPRRPE